jgi:serine protease Do
MKSLAFLTVYLAAFNLAFAQKNDVPLLLPEERQAVDEQTDAFNQAITPVIQSAAKSTVRLWSGSRRLSYGTVVGDGSQILSKWSEVARAKGEIIADSGENETRPVKMVSVYKEEDLVLLKIEGEPLTPVKWSLESAKIGDFLAAPQPDGRLAAFGVVSVLERNLRDSDLAYLGVGGDPDYRGEGVKIAEVSENSGAEAAGLKPNDVILKVGDRSISGLLELKNALTGVVPGTRVSLFVKSNGKARNIEVLLGKRPEFKQFAGDRLQQMERMGGPISQVRDSFKRAIQSDMRPKPNQIGGPVVDLEGNVLGVTLARADRTRSFIMPAAAILDLLKTEGENPALAQVRLEEADEALPTRGNVPRGQAAPGGEERMLRHLSDMQRLMDHMRSEMQRLEEP